jgi:hypothetical protein
MEIRKEALRNFVSSKNINSEEVFSDAFSELNVEELRYVCYQMWENMRDSERQNALDYISVYADFIEEMESW